MRKQMKIVHISDWHSRMWKLPPADLYVVTGDMLPNFPLITTLLPHGVKETRLEYEHLLGRPHVNAYFDASRTFKRKIIPEIQRLCQIEFISIVPSLRECFGNYDAPCVVVRGNHDFIDLAGWIGGDVWEVSDNPTRSVDIEGWKIGGFRGIKYIAGEWSDELRDNDILDRCDDLPKDLDILVTHAPPAGVFDRYVTRHGDARFDGSRELREWIREKGQIAGPLTAHLYGHVHESHDVGEPPWTGTVFSNAATGANVIDIYHDKLSEYSKLHGAWEG